MWVEPTEKDTIFISDAYVKYAKPYAVQKILDGFWWQIIHNTIYLFIKINRLILGRYSYRSFQQLLCKDLYSRLWNTTGRYYNTRYLPDFFANLKMCKYNKKCAFKMCINYYICALLMWIMFHIMCNELKTIDCTILMRYNTITERR